MKDKLGRFIKGFRSNPNTEFKKGKIGYWLGKKRTHVRIGYTHSEETRKKLSLSLMGHIPWNKGIKTGIAHWKGKKRINMMGSLNPAWRGGKPKCKICKQELSNRTATYCQNCANKIYHSSDKNYNWKGGITPINEKERKSPAYRRWRRSVLRRDNNKCIWCGNEKDLEVDHIKPFAYYPELRNKIGNGRTLCFECHKKTFIFYENQYINKFHLKGVMAP